jgi:carboxypeptidase Taq
MEKHPLANEALQQLKDEMGTIIDLRAALALMHWDQEVYMPPKAAPARGRQIATLSALAHERFTSAHFASLLEAAARRMEQLSPDDAALVRETQHDFEQATRLPTEFVERLAQEESRGYEAWTRARRDSDFAQFQPHLETLVDLLRKKADYLGYKDSPYDALLDEYERGMTAASLKENFGVLAREQSDIVARIAKSPHQPDLSWVHQEYDEQAQLDFTERVLKDLGYDFDAGRQDKSVHPFTTNFDLYDVRITTRVDPTEPFSALTGSIHECGHALYEQGFLPADQRTLLAEGVSLGIHESQSRMWENMIGRSLPFWQHYHGAFLAAHAPRLDTVSAEQIYRAINHVAPSFIRVEADECTYNLHIILRFEIELALIEGTLKVSEVPEAWNAKVKQYLGLDVPNDAMGCLQDIHWSHGSMGYFPTYALGNLYAAQLFEKIEEDIPGLWEQIGTGNFAPLLSWLRENIHRHGRRYLPGELLQRATGKPPSAESYLRYLRKKYGALYGLEG